MAAGAGEVTCHPSTFQWWAKVYYCWISNEMIAGRVGREFRVLVIRLLRHVGILSLIPVAERERAPELLSIGVCVGVYLCVCWCACVRVGHGFSDGICWIRQSEQLFRRLHTEISSPPQSPTSVPLWWLNFEIHIQLDASRGGNSEVHTFHQSVPVVSGHADGKRLSRLIPTRLSRLSPGPHVSPKACTQTGARHATQTHSILRHSHRQRPRHTRHATQTHSILRHSHRQRQRHT